MKFLLLLFLPLLYFFTDFASVCGTYTGEKDDYVAEFKLYDDSVFQYTGIREFPFEVSEGTWNLIGDTVILTTLPCKDPDALLRLPIRSYKTFVDEKFLFKKNSLIPIDKNNRLVKSESLQKEK